MLFSIVIPTYHRGEVLRRAIDSVMRQSIEDFEILVVDDGGSDHTSEILESYGDDRIKYFWKENEERSIARNYGIDKAEGDYICFLDSDDYYLPNHLEVAFGLIRSNNPVLIHTSFEIRDEDGKCLEKRDQWGGDIVKKMISDNLMHCNALIAKSDIIKSNLFIPDRYAVLAEDWHFFLKLICRYPVQFTTDITAVVVEHSHRSLNGLNSEIVVKSIELIIADLKSDPHFKKSASWMSEKRFYAKLLIFSALIFTMDGNRVMSIVYLRKALSIYPLSIFRKSFLAVIKNLIKRNASK